MTTPLRSDFDASGLRVLARNSKDAGQARRLLALAMIYEGGPRTEAAKTGGVTLQIVRDWVVKFNARGPSGLINGKGPGQPSLLNDAQRAALAAVVESGPTPAVHGVVRWRLVDLCQWVWEMFRISISPQTMSRELRAMDYRKLSVRPRHHGQVEGAIALFKRVSPTWRSRSRDQGIDAGRLEVWFCDEARVGQKTQLGRRWAKLGTRPVAALDQRTASTYIFGAICPLHGKAVGLILPECNIEAMNLHLAEIAAAVAPGAHAALILDQAGWHVSNKLIVPPNITLVPLPAKCPELNPIENVWQYMRANWLSDRIFEAYDDIVDHCADAWSKLAARPWTIMSIGMRDWANAY